jgi:hypothetical protein
MALIIEGGISIGGNINIIAENISPTANLVVFYDAGNSMSYNGSGSVFSTSYTGPNITGYQQYGILDLAGLTGGPWNSGLMETIGDSITWTSQGVASYFTLNASDQNYINSVWQREAPTLTSETYSIVAVVRPQDFNFGAIVCGNTNLNYFAFSSTGGLDDGPSLVAGNDYGNTVVTDTTTAFTTDTWYCVAVTYNADTNTMKLYTNGNLVSTGSTSPVAAPTGLYWGSVGGMLWYTGDMAVCMAYERVLGAGEISQLSDVYLSRYIAPPTTSSMVFDTPYTGGPPDMFTVPEGVYSISVVAVGGGGGGTQDEYSVPGGDTAMIRNDNWVYAETTYTGTSNNIVVDTTANPNIANVTADGTWVVGGNDIPGPGNGIPAWDLVTSVDTASSPGNAIIGIDQTITTTAGDQFFFYQGVAVAEGGYEISGSYYNQSNQDPYGPGGPPYGPGQRALPLVTDGPYGAGGVVDWTTTYPIGGGGAGGYGVAGLALSQDRSGAWYYNTQDEVGYHTMSFSNNNLIVTALSGMGTSQANQECMVLGTQTITSGDKVMYSVNVSQTAGIGYCGVGLSNLLENLNQFPGYSTNSVGYYDDGRVFTDDVPVDTFAVFNEGGIVDIAVDTDLALVWFRVAGGTWNSSGNPAAGTGGFDISSLLADGSPLTLALAPWYDDVSSTADIMSIATTAAYSVPAGFTFVPGVPNAGGTGGDGASFWAGTNKNGTGGSGAGGGGRFEDSGAGGSGTGLYGRAGIGLAGSFITDPPGNAVSTVSTGGSQQYSVDGNGGQATPWNGGRGGWPGGGGGSATDYYDGGNGGALAYRNNYSVTPGEEYIVLPGIGGLGQNNGGSGANGAVRIVWPGNTRQFPATNVGPDTVAVPTLDITSGNFSGSSPTGQVYFNITDDGGSEVLETGIVWGLPGQDTYLASTDVCDGSSDVAQRKAIRAADSCSNPFTTGLTGSQSLIFMADSGLYNETLDVRAYARNAAGVAYSPTVLTWTPTICLAEGTLITLADGSTKTIEAISMSDLIKVWDFDNGAVASATPLWIKRRESTIQYNAIEFSDGTILKTIGQHRIFNKQAKSFTYPMTDDTPVGTITVKSDGTEITLVSKKVVYEKVNYYNVITSGGYLNCYAEGILTSCRYSNMYPITNMQYNKDGRALRDRNEFVGISDRWIDGLRLPEQTIDIKHIHKYVERLENNEKQEPITRATTAWQQ